MKEWIAACAALLAVTGSLQTATAQPAVDFKNYTYRVHPCPENVPVAAVMKGGTFDYFDTKMAQGFTLSVEAVKTGSLAAGTTQAVVTLACDFPIGGTASAYLFAVNGVSATLLGKVADADWGGDWGAGPDSIRPAFANGTLRVTACADSDCKHTSVTTYVLRAGALAKVAVKTSLTTSSHPP